MKRGYEESDEYVECFHDDFHVVEDKRKWFIFRVVSGYCKKCGSHITRISVEF